MLNFTTTDKHALHHGVKVCVHGPAGAGKTRLIETCPSPIIGSAESGTLSIAAARIPMCEITSIEDLIDFRRWATGSNESRHFQTISLDSITEIAERLLSAEKKVSKDPRKAYGEMMDKVAVELRLFRDLPGKHVYFSCKSGLREMPDGTHMHFPIMPGNKTAEALPFYFDEFFFLGVSSYADPGPPAKQVTFRFLQTQRTATIEAKDRSGVLSEVEEPHLGKIFEKIRMAYATPAPALPPPPPPRP
jgi:AAA domain